MPDVLILGEDEMLLRTRAAVLQAGGISTVECLVRDLGDCSRQEYRLAVFCHSIRPSARPELSRQLRSRCPGIKLLQMDKLVVFASDNAAYADLTITAGNPSALISAVRRMLCSTGEPDPG